MKKKKKTNAQQIFAYVPPKPEQHALVFSYGSNMHPRQMAERCPGSRIVSVAKLHDHRLVFSGHNARWGGGVATIREACRSKVVGVLWRLSPANLNRLDMFEGFPYVYDRVAVRVETSSRRPIWCHTYVKNEFGVEPDTSPSAAYLDVILGGYQHVGVRPPVELERMREELQ